MKQATSLGMGMMKMMMTIVNVKQQINGGGAASERYDLGMQPVFSANVALRLNNATALSLLMHDWCRHHHSQFKTNKTIMHFT
jgi:hypothetical protein